MAEARLALDVLLNTLWQAMVLAALAWGLLRMLPRANAATRYAVWYAALVAVLVLPVLAAGWIRLTNQESIAAAPAPAVLSAAAGASDLRLPFVVPAGAAVTLLFFVWLAAVSALAVRLVRSYRWLGRLKRNSGPLEEDFARLWRRGLPLGFTGRSAELRCTRETPLPLLAGLRRPMILFPNALLSRLTPEQAYGICLHELAHARRWDDWTKLGQKLVETALFFHPVVRWMGRRLDLEREIACDDWVVSVTGTARPYAACLARLAELAADPSPALGTAGSRKQIFRRVEMLLSPDRNPRPYLSKPAFAGMLVALLAAAVMLATAPPVVAVEKAQEAPAVQVSPAPEPQPGPQEREAKPFAPPRPAPKQTPETSRPQEKRREIPEVREEIERLVERINEHVRSGIEAHVDEIAKLTREADEQIQKSIQPGMREIEMLVEQLAREQVWNPDSLFVRLKFEEQIREKERALIRPAEERVRALERQIREHERKIRPAEAEIRALEQKVRELESRLREKEEQMRRLQEPVR